MITGGKGEGEKTRREREKMQGRKMSAVVGRGW